MATTKKPIKHRGIYLAARTGTVSEIITGNQGSKEKYFKIDIELENLGDAEELIIDWSNAEDALNPDLTNSTKYNHDDVINSNNRDDNPSKPGYQIEVDEDGKIFSRKTLALALATMLCFSLTAPVFADTTYIPVAGEDVTFQKALVLDANANVPDITFEYSIAPGAAVAASSGKMAIISPSAATGVVGTPTIDTADYNPGDATVTSAEGVTLTADQKAALKTLTVDFSNVTFAEPGIYRYLITETSADQQGITYDTQINNANDAVSKQRTLDVYVTHSDAVGATEATEWSYGGNTYASLAEAEAARTAANDPTGEISNNATAGEAGLF